MDEDEDDEILARALEVLQRRAARKAAPAALTVRQLYDQYEAAMRSQRSWWSTRVKTLPFVDALGERPADDLKVIDWTTYATARLATPVPGKGERCYGVPTVNCELGCVKTMFYWGVTQGLLRFSPIAGVKRLKGRKRRETAPNEREVQRCLDVCQRPEETFLVLAAADVGLRRNEIRLFERAWLDAERRIATLPGWACKGGSGGTVPVTARFVAAVQAIPRNLRAPQVLISPQTQLPYSGAQLDKWFRGIRDRAGLRAAPGDGKAHLHDLRAGCATNALDRGVRLETVSKRILRHSSIATTEVYLRGKEVGNLDQAIAAMEAGIVRDQRRK